MRNVTGAEPDIVRAFNPSSVAVIGASSKAGTLSWWPTHLLATKGFTGRVFPINPTRDSIEGLRCYPDLQSVGAPVDLAVVALNAEKTLEAVRQCAAAGVRAVVLPTQGFGETGEEGLRIQRRIAALAQDRGMRIIGPNTDGIANLATGAIASIQPLFEESIEAGPVGLVTQSGATASSLVLRLKQSGIGCKLYASVGNEIDLGLVDFMSVMVQDPDIKIILSFVEALRRPAEFLKVAQLAAELGKPIVLIKVGRSEQGARRAAAHTGALAGADQLYDSLFASRGVLRVSELSEMVAVAKLFLSRGAPAAPGVGIISVSGGQAGALADKAAEMGIPVPTIGEETENRLNAALKFGKGFNPCDLTGEIATNPSLAVSVYEQFAREPGIGAIVYARKHLTANAGVAAGRMLGEQASKPESAPLAIYAMDGLVWGAEADGYRECNIPVFDNLHDLYTAVDRLSRWADARERSRRDVPASAAVSSRHAHRGVVADNEARQMLAAAGLRMPEEKFAGSAEAAVAAAGEIGYPVALKIVSARIPHKTEAGGVALNLRGAAEVEQAFERVMANAHRHLGDGHADGALVQQQIEGATEMIVGIKIDPTLGPFVIVGLGGIFTELLKDVSVRPAPVDLDTAHSMISGLRGAALLGGFRGRPTSDVAALARAIVDFSNFGVAESGWLVEADLNPLMVLDAGRGVRAIDVLLVGGE